MKSLTQLAITSMLIGASPLTQAELPFQFDSGSTGTEDLHVSCSYEGETTYLNVGLSGIRHFNSITIDEGCILKFIPTGNGIGMSSNPVRLLVREDVTIHGTINLDGTPGELGSTNYAAAGGIGGPGGYNGGVSGHTNHQPQAGYGPGGGAGASLASNGNCSSSSGANGSLTPRANDIRYQMLIGGSGGGGGCNSSSSRYYGGGGGGGAMLIAANGTITINGEVSAIGADTGSSNSYHAEGAGGVVHFIANRVAGSGNVAAGYSIIETNDNQSQFNIETTDGSNFGLQRLSLNLTQAPTLTITSVGGIDTSNINAVQLGSSGLTSVTVMAEGLAATTEVKLVVNSEMTRYNAVETATLNTQGIATFSIEVGSGNSVMMAYVSALVTNTAALPQFEGEKIMSARLEAMPGVSAQVVFYTESGRRVPDGFITNPMQWVSFI